MKKYEVLFVLNSAIGEPVIKETIEKFKTFLTNKKATELVIDEWGNKKLAYPIKFKNEGYYVLMSFKADVNVPNELTHLMNINENVFRNMCEMKEG